MEARRKRFEDLDITRDEIVNIGKALQKEEFRKLFADYCEEVNDPQNKELFQREITELEKQRGVDVTFINPEPGFVLKTSVDGNRKAFINICKNEKVSRPSSSPASQEGTTGRQWSLPFSLAPPREDLDKQRNRCSVFDVVFHPEALHLAEKSHDFRQMLIDSAVDAVENNCNVSLDRANLKFPKMQYKGLQQAAVVRKKVSNNEKKSDDNEFLQSIPFPVEENTWAQIQNSTKANAKNSDPVDFTLPNYMIKYRHGIDMADFTDDATSRLQATIPKDLVVEIELPLLKSANDVILDVSHKSLSLLSEKPKYKLDLVLPYGVNEDAGRATFDTSKRKLTLLLPVKKSKLSLSDTGREDSGVESDQGARPDDECDDKSPSENSDEGCEGSDNTLVQEVPFPDEGTKCWTSTVSKCSVDQLFKNDVLYSLPQFTCNAFNDVIAFTLHVKNVEETSVRHQIIKDSQGIQCSFTSLGGGLFPQYYGLCIVFPDDICLDDESLGFEVWDNNVVVQVRLKNWSEPITSLSVGTHMHNLQTQEFPSLAHIEKVLSNLQVCTDIPVNPPEPAVDVLSLKPDEVILTLKCGSDMNPETEQLKSLPENKSDNHEISQLPQSTHAERSHRKLNVRQLSECSSDELNGVKIRGILKKRPVRSLSESNAEEYAWFHRSISDDGESADLSSALGSELCVADEGSEAGCETENDSGDRLTKKTVRFSDVIAQQTFRPNSSILGQRKKNQRKQRNKKRAQERRASESENSEPEPEFAKIWQVNFSGEPSVSEAKYNKNNFMKEAPCVPEDKPAAKKILRGTASFDSDEDKRKNNSSLNDENNAVENVIPIKNSSSRGDSSEDERDVKTEDSKKKKKKKGKKNLEKVSNNPLPVKSCSDQPQFDSTVMLDLEL